MLQKRSGLINFQELHDTQDTVKLQAKYVLKGKYLLNFEKFKKTALCEVSV